jgi:hypothetical protein
VCFGAVTFTTPSGWTKPTNSGQINNGGLYVFYRTAAGSDTITTVNNSSNYPIMADFFEFAAGSTFVACAGSTGVASGGAGPTLSGLTGSNWIAATGGVGAQTGTSSSATWNTGVEATDFFVQNGATDGYEYSLTYLDGSVLTSASAAMTVPSQSNTAERLVFAVNVAGGAPAIPPILVMQTRRAY